MTWKKLKSLYNTRLYNETYRPSFPEPNAHVERVKEINTNIKKLEKRVEESQPEETAVL